MGQRNVELVSVAGQPMALEAGRSGVRWVVCALLFAATTINYVDRGVIAVLKPALTDRFQWSETDYGNIIFAFQLAYAIGLVAAGYALDRLGERRGLALAVGLWSVAALGHGMLGYVPLSSSTHTWGVIAWLGGTSVAAFATMRFMLGLAEAANFPASIKTVAEWFPRRQRATATGLFNSGSNLGALLTPVMVPWIAVRWGWPAAFYFTGSLGFLWVIVWLAMYRRPEMHPGVSVAELAFIRSEDDEGGRWGGKERGSEVHGSGGEIDGASPHPNPPPGYQGRKQGPRGQRHFSASPGTPGEGGGEGSERPALSGESHGDSANPHPDPLPEYRAREKDSAGATPIIPDYAVGIISAQSLLGHSQTWMFSLAKFLTDPIWWFYLFWIPDFLHKMHKLDLLALGPPLVVIYVMADLGSIGGGWLSSALLKGGWSVNAARKTALLVCALCVVPVFFASLVANVWLATLLIGLAAAGHQGFSANLFTLVSDTVPRKAVSSVVGIGGTAGAIGGMCIAKIAGYVLDTTGSYVPLFAIASLAYLVALAAIQIISPTLAPMRAGDISERRSA